MRILDQNDVEVVDPNLELGHLVDETIFVAHHDAVPEIPRSTALKLVSENGTGALYKRVVVQPFVPAKPAWDELETIMRFVPYTDEELAQMESDRIAMEADRLAAEAAEALQRERDAFADAAPDALIEISEKLDAIIDALVESDPKFESLKEAQNG